ASTPHVPQQPRNTSVPVPASGGAQRRSEIGAANPSGIRPRSPPNFGGVVLPAPVDEIGAVSLETFVVETLPRPVAQDHSTALETLSPCAMKPSHRSPRIAPPAPERLSGHALRAIPPM